VEPSVEVVIALSSAILYGIFGRINGGAKK
jgi:hypothetical protein